MSHRNWRQLRGRGIRLSRDLYGIPRQATSVTIGTHRRAPIFLDDEFAHSCIKDLENASIRSQISVIAYCYMPDHVHLLLQPEIETDLVKFIQSYKRWTTRQAWNHGIPGKLWQRSFYDHILRKSEDLERLLRYIIENPVRAEIVDDWREYPYTGSLIYDLEQMDW